jgi:hypothetical protein
MPFAIAHVSLALCVSACVYAYVLRFAPATGAAFQ